VLARLGKTLSTNAAVGGLALLVLGAGGTTATLVAGKSPVPTPNSHASSDATDATDDADESADDATETDSQDSGTRPTDTHGYCVSQVAQAETTSTDPGAHGKAVSAAAHACGKDGAASQADAHRQNGKHGKALGKNHGTGRPAGVTPGSAAPR
jgi:hypothetical protein